MVPSRPQKHHDTLFFKASLGKCPLNTGKAVNWLQFQTCAKICLTLNANYGLARTHSIQKKVFHDISSIWIYIYILYIYELYACIYRNKLLWYSFINILIYCNLVQMLSHVDAFWHLCVWFGMGSNDSRRGNDYVRAKIAEAWNLTKWYDANALTELLLV